MTATQFSAEWLGEQFPELTAIQPLSQGGQKQVFSAQHPIDGDIVLKLMHPGADLQRTERELVAVARVQAHRIPKIFAFGTIQTTSGELLWFREQRIRGETLRERLQRGPLSTSDLLRLAYQVCSTLAEAEKVAIVHRDVKPENIIVDSANNYWLIDFGLARHLGLESLTATANVFGHVTWGYAPLEQCRNIKQEIDSRADLFALGVTLFECATGTNPFRSGARSVLDVLGRVESGVLPRLELNFKSREQFADLVASLTQRSRIHRPRTVAQALEWITDICKVEGLMTILSNE